MPCCSSSPEVRDRYVFTSILLCAGLLAMQASPHARTSFGPLLVLLGVPAMTFAVAAPGRLGLWREIGLFLRGLEAFALSNALLLIGRVHDAVSVRAAHRVRVEDAYEASHPSFSAVIREDRLRFHHVRRLASFVTVGVVLAGMTLPMLESGVFTFGEWPAAPFVWMLDLVTFAVAGRVVTERMALRLLELTRVARAPGPIVARLTLTPVAGLLGLALGAVGALVVVGAGAVACALETGWLSPDVPMVLAARWWFHQTAVDAMGMGMAFGAIMGMGVGLAIAPRVTQPRSAD